MFFVARQITPAAGLRMRRRDSRDYIPRDAPPPFLTGVLQLGGNIWISLLRYLSFIHGRNISRAPGAANGACCVKVAAGSEVEDRGLPPTVRRRRVTDAADAASWRGLKAPRLVRNGGVSQGCRRRRSTRTHTGSHPSLTGVRPPFPSEASTSPRLGRTRDGPPPPLG